VQIGGPIAIVDNGTTSIKAGLKINDTPHQAATVVGVPTSNTQMQFDCKEIYVGDDALKKSKQAGFLNMISPITSSLITDWESME
jgi:actin-related protein